MLNKKILAVAVTAAMTQGLAHANPTQLAVDLDGANGDYQSGAVSYVKELTWGSELAVVDNADGTPSYLTGNIGFTIAEGTNKYIRIDLAEGATFESVPRLKWDTVADNGTGASTATSSTADANNTGILDQSPLAQTHNGMPNPQSSIAEGGLGESYVVFEVNAFEETAAIIEDIPSFLSFYVEVDKYKLPTDVITTARYRLYEDAIDAQRANEETLKDTQNVNVASFVDGVNEEFAIPNNAYASVDSEYTVFIHDGSQYADHDETNYYDEQQSGNDANNDGGFDTAANWTGSAVSATTASLGEVDTDLLATAGNLLTDLDGGQFDNDDVVGTDPVVTFSGDFSYGEWYMVLVGTAKAGDSCDGGTAFSPDALLSTSSSLVFDNFTQAELQDNDYVLCVDVDGMTSDVDDNLLVGVENPWEDGNRIQESTYSATLSWDTVLPEVIADETGAAWTELLGADVTPVTDDMGEVIYDSITIDVPFMSTFEDYKQRFHLTNTGPTPAKYMFEFVTEGGTVVDSGAEASGTIPAGETIVVQTANVVTFVSGNTRAAAKLHIGGEDEDISVSALIVNPEKGTIDIQDLNANSIKARKANFLPGEQTN